MRYEVGSIKQSKILKLNVTLKRTWGLRGGGVWWSEFVCRCEWVGLGAVCQLLTSYAPV